MKVIKAGLATDLKAGEMKKVSAEGREILLVNIGDAYYAVDNTCPHMGGSLVEGSLSGSRITCPRHGSAFDVTTGKAVENGKLLFMRVRPHDLRSYPVSLDGAEIMIRID